MQEMQELVEKLVKDGDRVSVQIAALSDDCVEAVKKLEVECNLSPWAVGDYKKEIARADSFSMVAKNGAEVVGFAVTRLITIEIDKIHPKVLKEIELYNIAVNPKFRKQGIAQALLNQLLGDAASQKVSKIRLEVRASNAAAIQFYKKNGFNPAYVRNNFYSSPPENGIVMELDLSNSPEIRPDRDDICDKLA
jgi:[ribosomal protein S18]-alanine N-acetyltransferase